MKKKAMVVTYYITEYKKNGNLRAWIHKNFKRKVLEGKVYLIH